MPRKVAIACVHRSAPALCAPLCARCCALTVVCVCGGYAWLRWLQCDSNALAAVAGVRIGTATSAATATTVQHMRHMDLLLTTQPLFLPRSLRLQRCSSATSIRTAISATGSIDRSCRFVAIAERTPTQRSASTRWSALSAWWSGCPQLVSRPGRVREQRLSSAGHSFACTCHDQR